MDSPWYKSRIQGDRCDNEDCRRGDVYGAVEVWRKDHNEGQASAYATVLCPACYEAMRLRETELADDDDAAPVELVSEEQRKRPDKKRHRKADTKTMTI